MDRVEHIRGLIRSILQEFASYKPTYGDVDVEIVADDTAGHYELWHIGWNRWERIHACILHIDFKGDKIWIQHDGTEDGIANDLMEAGISPQEIVLAFHPPSERRLTPFAVS